MGRLALAGRPLSGDHGQVDQAAALALLEQGDLVPRAPRLGGMARAEGVVIVSERFWAFDGTGTMAPFDGPALAGPARS